MRRTLSALLLMASGLVYACTDGRAPLDPASGARASVILAPSFASFPAADAQAIVQIRVTARNAATGETLKPTPVVISVDPNDSEWSLPVEVEIPTGSGVSVVFEMELLNGVGQVEFSVRTEPVQLKPGTQPSVVGISDAQIGRGPAGNLDIQSVALTPAEAALVEGESVDLAAAVQPAGTSASFFWRSLDPAIADIVSTSGASARIAAHLPGVARIEVMAGSRADTAQVAVAQKVGGVVLSPAEVTVSSLGETIAFTARVVDPRGDEVPGVGVTWSSTAESVLKNLGGGGFEAIASGNANVLAAVTGAPQIVGVAAVSVRQTVARVEISPDGATLESLGDSVQLQATATDARGNTVPGRTVGWTSSDASVATVDARGLVVAVRDGRATITATADGVASSVAVTVRQRARTVTVSPDSVELTSRGATQQLAAVARDARGNRIDRSVAWGSTDASVAAVDASGLVSAGASGRATVEARMDDAVGSARVVVVQKVATLELTPAQAKLAHLGATQAFVATPRDESGAAVPGKTVLWSSSDPTVATVDATGVAVAVGGGTTTISATVDGVGASATLTVEQTVASVGIEPGSLTFESLGLELGLQAVARDAGGAPIAGRTFAWSSSDAAVATVSPVGGVRSVANGTTTVTATLDGISGTAEVTVAQVPVQARIEPATATLEQPGDTVRLAAVVVDGNGFGLAGLEPAWSSSDAAVATVDQAGLVTATGSGTATITVSAAGFAPTATVTVGGAGATGDMIVLSDVNLFDSWNGLEAQNRQFSRNLVTFTNSGPRSAATKVLYDCGRSSWNYGCSGYVVTLDTAITNAGYTIARQSAPVGTLTSIPADVKALFLWMPVQDYTNDEVNAMKHFVAQGGRIVFVSENGNYFSRIFPVQDALMADMGSTMTTVGDCDYGLRNTSSHQTTVGAETLWFNCSSYQTNLGPRDSPVVVYGAKILIAAIQVDTTPVGGASASLFQLRPGDSTGQREGVRPKQLLPPSNALHEKGFDPTIRH